ncbi:MAG: Hsp70 family protein, partial [Pseudomonadota bacterium]
MSLAIGIDLGTTNCCVAVQTPGGVRVMRVDQRDTMPSILVQTAEGDIIVGARALMKKAPLFRYAFVKREMGSDTEFELKDRRVSASDISAEFLKTLKDAAEKDLGTEVTSAVVTIPAHFGLRAEKDTLDAAMKAGFRNVEVLREPVAAAVACFQQKDLEFSDFRTILVYDVGGGTTDVTVCSRTGDHFQVEAGGKAYGGDQFLGGVDLDRTLVGMALQEAERQGFAFSLEENRGQHQYSPLWWDFMEEAERVKHLLSKKMEAEWQQSLTRPDGEKLELVFYVTRKEYEARIRPILIRTMSYCDEALLQFARSRPAMGGRSDMELAMEAARRIDAVVLVGGSSRTPLVKEMIENHFSEKYNVNMKVRFFEPDKCVAMGAALKAATLRTGPAQNDTAGPRILWSALERNAVSGGVEIYPAGTGRIEGCGKTPAVVRVTLPNGESREILPREDGTFPTPEIPLSPGENRIRVEVAAPDGQLLANAENVIRRGGLSTSREGLARPFRVRLADAPDAEILPVGVLPGARHRTTLYVGNHDGAVRLPVYEGYRAIGSVEFKTHAPPGTPVDLGSVYEAGRVTVGVCIGDSPEQTGLLEVEPLRTDRRLGALQKEFRELLESTRLLLLHMEEELAGTERAALDMLAEERKGLILDVTLALERTDLADLSRVQDRLLRLKAMEWHLQMFAETSDYIRSKAVQLKDRLDESGHGMEETERQRWIERLDAITRDPLLDESLDARKAARSELADLERNLLGPARGIDVSDAYIE